MLLESQFALASIVEDATRRQMDSDALRDGTCAPNGVAMNPTRNVTTRDLDPGWSSKKRKLSECFAGSPISSIVCIELCAGSARLSAALAAKGFKTTAVDHIKNRHRQCHPCIKIDLSTDEGYKYVLSLLKSGLVMYLHAAPPCGTASRAREKKISSRLKKKGVPEPRPLRSTAFPEGLPSLAGSDKTRVLKANDIYKRIALLVETAMQMNIVASVENPTRSYLWTTKFFKHMIDLGDLHEVTFQQCMWGSSRNKWSTWYVSHSCFDEQAVLCDGLHEHEGWTIRKVNGRWHFATADEAEYPQELCNKVADIILQVAINAGGQQLQTQPKQPKTKNLQLTMAAAGRQPRGDKFPAIIPEFAYKVSRQTSLALDVKKNKHLSAKLCDELQVPHPAKLLQIETGKDEEEKKYTAEIGVWRTPDEFVEQAMLVQHPFDDSSSMDDTNKMNIFLLLTEGPEARATKCKISLEYYKQRAAALQEEEDFIHRQLDEDRQRIVKGKRSLLFEEMCRDAGIHGEDLHHLQLAGVNLTGEDGDTRLFTKQAQKPAMSVVQLMKSSKWSRNMILRRKKEQTTDEVRQAVWDTTLGEVERGWLQGPFTEQQVRLRLGPLFVASKRFGLEQSDKVRQIDNLSESLVNAAYRASYKLDLDGVDGISVMARTFVEATTNDRVVRVQMRDGSWKVGKLHESLSVSGARNIAGLGLSLQTSSCG